MRRDWLVKRDKLIKLWNGEGTQKRLFGHLNKPWLVNSHEPDTRPWASEIFDSNQAISAAGKLILGLNRERKWAPARLLPVFARRSRASIGEDLTDTQNRVP